MLQLCSTDELLDRGQVVGHYRRSSISQTYVLFSVLEAEFTEDGVHIDTYHTLLDLLRGVGRISCPGTTEELGDIYLMAVS
jgi:hypothetical protein